MKTIRVLRFALKICLVVVLSAYAFYSFNSGRVAARAMKCQVSGEDFTASIAWQAVATNYPLSVFEPFAKVYLAINNPGKSLSLDRPVYFNLGGGPIAKAYVTMYALPLFGLFLILLYGIFGSGFALLHENRDKAWRKACLRLILATVLCLVLIGLALFINDSFKKQAVYSAFGIYAVLSGLSMIFGIVLLYKMLKTSRKCGWAEAEAGEECLKSGWLVYYRGQPKPRGLRTVYGLAFALTTLFFIVTYTSVFNNKSQVQAKENYTRQSQATISESMINPKDIYYIVSVAKLNVRTGPGARFNIKATVIGGQKLKLIKLEEDWALVSFNVQDGWVHCNYIKRQ